MSAAMRETGKPFAPACERNRDPILAVLRVHLANARNVLEIGSALGALQVYPVGSVNRQDAAKLEAIA